jgi:hypothetical protein
LRLIRNLTACDPEFDRVPVPELLRRAEGRLNIILNSAINGEEADIQHFRPLLQDLRKGDATIMIMILMNELWMNFGHSFKRIIETICVQGRIWTGV